MNIPSRLTPDEFRDGLASVSMGVLEFARFTGTNERTARRWLDGLQDIPPWTSTVLWLLEERLAGGISHDKGEKQR